MAKKSKLSDMHKWTHRCNPYILRLIILLSIPINFVILVVVGVYRIFTCGGGNEALQESWYSVLYGIEDDLDQQK